MTRLMLKQSMLLSHTATAIYDITTIYSPVVFTSDRGREYYITYTIVVTFCNECVIKVRTNIFGFSFGIIIIYLFFKQDKSKIHNSAFLLCYKYTLTY